MKKLNRKGFTLVELLAVIIILAIVIGIAIPGVTSVINGSKNSALGIATESAYDYLRDQYDIYNIEPSTAAPLIKTIIGEGNDGTTLTSENEIETLGYKSTNVKEVYVKVAHNPSTQTADICVKVTKIVADGEYFVTSYWTLSADGKTATPTDGASGLKNQAGNCS